MLHVIACATSALLLHHIAAPLSATCPVGATGGEDEIWTQVELERISAEIGRDVEKIRGLEFQREVAVKLADRDSFIGYAKERLDESETPDSIRADEYFAKMLGLIPPEMDLLAKTLEVLEEQVGGFYDPSSETFYLMRTFTGGLAKVILAHELTHALDDQYHDIDGTLKELDGEDDRTLAYQAVVEGSGTAVMNKWLFANLGQLDLGDLKDLGGLGTEGLSTSPAAIWKPLLAVYQQGEAFLKRSEKISLKGVASEDIERAFLELPRSTEQILHPDKYWGENTDEPRRVRIDTSAAKSAGWKVLNETTMGELILALFTAPESDRGGLDLSNPLAALKIRFTNDAAAGWGGDRCVLLEQGDALVLHMDTRWDTEDDAGEFSACITGQSEWLLEHLGKLHVLRGGDPESRAFGVRVHQGPVGDQVRVTTWVGLDNGRLDSLFAGLKSSAEGAPAGAGAR